MNVTRKDATITNTGADTDFPGTFEVVLSAPTLDRDGETLLAEDWKKPLPEHITFDTDHGMSVATTVGSGAPRVDEGGRLIVDGSYSSLPRAQETRTLVREGHIRTTSVAYMSSKSTKDGKSRTERELLNGAFVAIPSNREAVILSSKSGARNSKTDGQMIQSIHDQATALGADCPMDDTGAAEGATGGKSVTLCPSCAKNFTVEDEDPDAGEPAVAVKQVGDPAAAVKPEADELDLLDLQRKAFAIMVDASTAD